MRSLRTLTAEFKRRVVLLVLSGEKAAAQLHAIWVADITYVHLKQDFVYLAVRKPIHSSFDYLNPAEFEARWRVQQAQPPLLS